MEEQHIARVKTIAQRIALFYKQKRPFNIYHGATNSTRLLQFEKRSSVDTSELNHVFAIDSVRKVAVVEANVPMDKLVRATLREGLAPPVVMEFPGITVGGGLQGGAGESSSYKWGTFNRTLNWYEIILANGVKRRVSRDTDSDLFWGGAGAYGTLGVVTRAEIQLLPARRYVEVTYITIHSFAEAVEVLTREIKRAEPDFIDGIMFSKMNGVIIVGNLSDTVTAPVYTFTKSRDEWFYLHAERHAQTSSMKVEMVPLYDYLFRYDRGAFWMGAFAFKRFKTPFNAFTRWLLDPLMHTRKMYEALQVSGLSQECIIQDLALPTHNAAAFMEYIDKRFSIYPLWLCPLLNDDKSPLLSSYLATESIINIGVWGGFSGTHAEFVKANRELEATTNKLDGKKWLYAHTYYNEPTFWKIYSSKAWYEKLRKKYYADSLPTVFDKVRVRGYRKVNAKKGVLFAFLGIKNIYHRKSK